MPIKHAAIKALRQTLRRTAVNRSAKDKLNNLIKKFKQLVEQGNQGEAKTLWSTLQKRLDKAAGTHLLLRNTVNRRKSLLLKLFNAKFAKK
jgi:ribosomal protein S20